MSEPQKDRAPRGRGTADVRRHADRKKRVKESLTELCDLADELRGRSSAPVEDIVDIVRRDCDRMAEVLAAAAGRVAPVAFLIDKALGAGGPLSIAQSFGPFLRALLRKAREIREEQAEAAEEARQRLVDLGLVPEQIIEPFADAAS